MFLVLKERDRRQGYGYWTAAVAAQLSSRRGGLSELLIASGHRGRDGGYAGNFAGCLTTQPPYRGLLFAQRAIFGGRDGKERDAASWWMRKRQRRAGQRLVGFEAAARCAMPAAAVCSAFGKICVYRNVPGRQWLARPGRSRAADYFSWRRRVLRLCPETSGRIAKFSEHEAN